MAGSPSIQDCTSFAYNHDEDIAVIRHLHTETAPTPTQGQEKQAVTEPMMEVVWPTTACLKPSRLDRFRRRKRCLHAH